jgi:hypothetical protein
MSTHQSEEPPWAYDPALDAPDTIEDAVRVLQEIQFSLEGMHETLRTLRWEVGLGLAVIILILLAPWFWAT